MPKRRSFVITNNPIGKDPLKDVKPKGRWQYTSMEGGQWRDLAPDMNTDDPGADERLMEQMDDDGRIIEVNNHWRFIVLSTVSGRVLVAHSLMTPDGRRWNAVNGWNKPLEAATGPEGGVPGPQY